jgi:hypothetical protein
MEALSADDAAEIARGILPRLTAGQVATLLTVVKPDAALIAAMGNARAALAAVVGTDLEVSRLIVSLHQHEPDVERQLGIRRSAGQQRR